MIKNIPASEVIELYELRIGNILMYDGRFVHVTKLDMDVDDESTDEIGFCDVGKGHNETADWNRSLCDKLRRVPLTPEILEAAGFLPLTEIPGCYSIINSLTEIRVNPSKDFATIIKPSFSEERVVVVPMDIKHLHQLQNLYFALTGMELEIKLPTHA